MGYETRLIIGTVSIVGNDNYFLKSVEIDLGKCGSDGTLQDLITKATARDYTDANKDYPEVYWSKNYSVEQEKIFKTIFGEDGLDNGKKEEFIELLGTDEDVIKENIAKLSDLFEDWESSVTEDSYGSKLRAVPAKEVYDALIISNAESIVNDGHSYVRFELAIALLKIAIEHYGENLKCVLYGY